MGLSASQARLLSITQRINNNELQSEFISNSKIQLANQNVKASEKYINALGATKMEYISYNETGITQNTALTFNAMTQYSPLKNQYNLFNSNGQVLVSAQDAKNYENSLDLAGFLNKYNLITNKTNDPIFKAEHDQWQIEHDEWEKTHNDRENTMLLAWQEQETSNWQLLHDAWQARKDTFDNKTIPNYNENQTIYDELKNSLPVKDASTGEKYSTLYEAFSSMVGTHDHPVNTGSGEAGYCYNRALSGNVGCYRHLLNHLIDYTGSTVSNKTYTTSSGVKHTLGRSTGGMGNANGNDFKAISDALNLTYSNGEAIFLCDGDDNLTDEEIALTATITAKSQEISAKIAEINTIQEAIHLSGTSDPTLQEELALKRSELATLQREKQEAERQKSNQNKLAEARNNYQAIAASSTGAAAVAEAQNKVDTINAEIADLSTQIATKEARVVAIDVDITAANSAISAAQTNYDAAIASGDNAAAAAALAEKNNQTTIKTNLETEKAQLQTEISEHYTQKNDATGRLADANTELTTATATNSSESAALAAAQAEIDKWTLLSDYKLARDRAGNILLDEEGNEIYELKSIKQKAIDLDYALSTGTLSAAEILPTIINFTDGDMQMISIVAPEKPYFDEPEPILDLSNPPKFEIKEPIEPVFSGGTIVDTEKAQWYINLYYLMGGSDTPETLQQGYSDELSLTYYQLKQPVVTPADFEKQYGKENYTVIEDTHSSSADWLQQALLNGNLTMTQARLSSNGNIQWSGIEFSSTSDIIEVEDTEKISLAEAEYEKTVKEIQIEDKQLDQKMRKLDTEHSALGKELESIKSVMDKNTEHSFTVFS